MSVCEDFTVHELLALQEQGAVLTDAEAARVDAWRAAPKKKPAFAGEAVWGGKRTQHGEGATHFST